MSAIAIKYFDTLAFVKKSKKFGAPEELAEYQIKEYEKAIETAVANMKEEFKIADLATKQDLFAVKEDLLATKVELKKEILDSEKGLRSEMALLKSELQKEVIHSRNQTILWVVGFLVANGILQHFTHF